MLKWIKKVPYWYVLAIPLLSIALGTLSNQAVLWANGDKFPVMYNSEKVRVSCQTPDAKADVFAALIGGQKNDKPSIFAPAPAPKNVDPNLCQNGGKFLDDTHVIMDQSSRLKFLADIVDFHEATYSIGDGFIIFGDWVLSWVGIVWLTLVVRKVIET